MLLDTRAIQLMNAFESLTHAMVSDCFEAEDVMCFLVKNGELGKAIGKNGANIANARRKFNKNIVIFEDADTPRELIEKACHGLKVSPLIEGKTIRIDVPRSQRENITGRQIRLIKEMLKRKLDAQQVDFVFV